MINNRIKAIGFLAVLSIIWGSSFILMKKGLAAYSPDQVGALRIVIAGTIFLPFVLLRKPNITLKQFKYIVIFGFLEIGIPPFLFTFAQTVVDSSTAGILNGLTPLFTLLLGIILFGISFNFLKISGVLLGFVGAIMLVFLKKGGGIVFDFTNAYGLLIVFATILYGYGGNYLKKYLNEVPGFTITSLSFVSMGIPAAIYLLFFTDFISIPLSEPKNLQAFISIATLSTFGSAIAILMFSILIKTSSALFASFVTYFIPFVALGWGYLDGEQINFYQIFALAVILGGITITNIGERMKMKTIDIK